MLLFPREQHSPKVDAPPLSPSALIGRHFPSRFPCPDALPRGTLHPRHRATSRRVMTQRPPIEARPTRPPRPRGARRRCRPFRRDVPERPTPPVAAPRRKAATPRTRVRAAQRRSVPHRVRPTHPPRAHGVGLVGLTGIGTKGRRPALTARPTTPTPWRPCGRPRGRNNNDAMNLLGEQICREPPPPSHRAPRWPS